MSTSTRRDTWYRARSLDQLAARFAEPSVVTLVEARLAEGRPVRILEIGCGEAHALMALAWRYRDRPVSLAGLNDAPTETMAGADDLREACVDFDLCTRQEAARLRLPALVFADAGERLPFADAAFDLVVSGTTFPCIVDKARALMEVARVLDVQGTALIHLDSYDPKLPDFLNTAGDPHLFTPRFVIYDTQRNRLSTAAYLTRFASDDVDIRVEASPGKPTHTVVRFTRRGRQELDFNLTLDDVSTIPRMDDHFAFKKAVTRGLWWGARSVYVAQDAG